MNQQLDIDGPDLPDAEYEAWLDEIHALAQQEAEDRYWDERVAKWEEEQREREIGEFRWHSEKYGMVCTNRASRDSLG